MGHVGLILRRQALLFPIPVAIALSMSCAKEPPAAVAELPAADVTVCSVSLMGDEILSLLVGDERLVCVSSLADDGEHSNVAGRFPAEIPRLAARIEPILATRPGVVVAAPWNDKRLLDLLERSHVPSLVLDEVDTFDEIFEQVERLGELLGEGDAAAEVVAASRASLAEIEAAVRGAESAPRVLAFSHSVVAGRGTTTDEMIRRAGGENVAALSGIEGHRKLSTEWIVATDFDVLLLGFDPGQSADQVLAAYPHLSATRAVREGRVIVMAPRHTMTVSPFLLQGVARLARELHPGLEIPEPSWR